MFVSAISANLGGNLSAERIYGKENCATELAKALNIPSFVQMIKTAQIVPISNEKFTLVEETRKCEDEKEKKSGGMKGHWDPGGWFFVSLKFTMFSFQKRLTFAIGYKSGMNGNIGAIGRANLRGV